MSDISAGLTQFSRYAEEGFRELSKNPGRYLLGAAGNAVVDYWDAVVGLAGGFAWKDDTGVFGDYEPVVKIVGGLSIIGGGFLAKDFPLGLARLYRNMCFFVGGAAFSEGLPLGKVTGPLAVAASVVFYQKCKNYEPKTNEA
jgi:hypothetical protein